MGYEATEAESALPWKRDELDGEPELSRFSRASGAEEALATPMPGYWSDRMENGKIDLRRRFFEDTASTGSDPFTVEHEPVAAGSDITATGASGNDPIAAGSDPAAAGSDMADSSHGATGAIDDEAVGADSDEFKTTVL